jgi:hypothetical protein
LLELFIFYEDKTEKQVFLFLVVRAFTLRCLLCTRKS